MSLTTSFDNTDNHLNIVIEGAFDFSLHQPFRDAYEQVDQVVDQYHIDFKQVAFLDSSALGMLLLLRDYAGGDKAKIILHHCNYDLKKILAIANFDQLFTIQ